MKLVNIIMGTILLSAVSNAHAFNAYGNCIAKGNAIVCAPKGSIQLELLYEVIDWTKSNMQYYVIINTKGYHVADASCSGFFAAETDKYITCNAKPVIESTDSSVSIPVVNP